MYTDLTTAAGWILLVTLILSLLLLANAQRLGEILGVMDHPNVDLKRHEKVTPLVGGLAIMLPLSFWIVATLALTSPVNVPLLWTILLCAGGGTLIGFADDQNPVSPYTRLALLFVFACTAQLIDSNLVPTQINWTSFTPVALPSYIAFGFIALAMAGYVNAVNMADGQNGIVSGMFVIWSLCLLLITHGLGASITQGLLEVSLAVLCFNLAGRVFLGDAGTYGVTFVFGLLAINAHNNLGVPAETIIVWFFIPVVDCLRLIVTRSVQGRPPFMGDRDHFHHRLSAQLGQMKALVAYLAAVGVTSIVATMEPHLSWICMILLAAFYFSFAWREGVAEVAAADGSGPAADAKTLDKDLRAEGGSRTVIPFEAKDHSRS
jgi:UDP-GlcNAc:undecaprenyl-phosphate GlcNAc-1-phosphate transferase